MILAMQVLPAVLIAGLTFWAVQPRIDEFRVGGLRRSSSPDTAHG